MNKELDYLDDILKNEPMTLNKRMIIECIKEKIQRIEAIDNAKPSEAMKWLEKSKNIIIEDNGDFITFDCLKVYSVCEQALIKAQEQEKALKELIKLINDLEQTFNRKGVSSDTDILGTIIKNYFVDNASDLLMRWLG